MSTHAYCSNLRRAVPPLARRHKVTAARHRAHPLLPVLLFVAPFRPAAKIQNDLRILTERLARINDNLARKITSRNEYDKTIQETEAAYLKILESSQTLLTVLKRESMGLERKSTGPGAV